jgi:hypothetical protein
MRNNPGGGGYGDMRGWHGGWWQFSSRARNDVGLAPERALKQALRKTRGIEKGNE